MLKIVEVHPAPTPKGEYLVLRNEGLNTIDLREWMVSSEGLFTGAENRENQLYVFPRETLVKPYVNVVLFTGEGEDGWAPTVDNKRAWCAFWQRKECVWRAATHVHVLRVAATRRVPLPTDGALAPATDGAGQTQAVAP
ncbi:MAG: lamin tail domain-containing protein [Armatimonadetes bacterium]|nr:lamin tail domain-containing protein [Armatimonadota bacterium]MDE2206562.1 lamin tail domain-containing protein [Armatimonadota bacterium]